MTARAYVHTGCGCFGVGTGVRADSERLRVVRVNCTGTRLNTPGVSPCSSLAQISAVRCQHVPPCRPVCAPKHPHPVYSSVFFHTFACFMLERTYRSTYKSRCSLSHTLLSHTVGCMHVSAHTSHRSVMADIYPETRRNRGEPLFLRAPGSPWYGSMVWAQHDRSWRGGGGGCIMQTCATSLSPPPLSLSLSLSLHPQPPGVQCNTSIEPVRHGGVCGRDVRRLHHRSRAHRARRAVIGGGQCGVARYAPHRAPARAEEDCGGGQPARQALTSDGSGGSACRTPARPALDEAAMRRGVWGRSGRGGGLWGGACNARAPKICKHSNSCGGGG